VIVTRDFAEIRGSVDPTKAKAVLLRLRVSTLVSVGDGSKVTIDLPTIGVTWYFDDVNRRLVITNNTSNSYDIVLAYEI